MKIINKYRKKFGYDEKSLRDKIALDFMKNCESVLDIGCGEGRFISQDPKKISGIDHNFNSVKLCVEKGYSVKQGKVTELPFDNESFDAVHCAHVIEHLLPDDAYKMISEMHRILKVGGVFCLRTPMLHDGFYNDFTHIKPYNPEAILHYISTVDGHQRTLNGFDCLYEKIDLIYRKKQFFSSLLGTRFWVLGGIFNILHRFGISSFKRSGYMLILKKKK